MVVRAKVAHDAENERREKIREATQKKINALAIKASRGIKPVVKLYSLGCPDRTHCDVELANIRTDEMLPMFDIMRANERIRWDEKEVKEKIRLQLAGMTKPSPTRLLDNPDAVAAMDAMLKSWSK